jgi:predicted RNA-binding Zn ribbon-like protein
MDELIHDDDDLATWLEILIDVPEVSVGVGDLSRAIVVRAAITECALVAIEGGLLPRAAVGVLNRAAAEPPVVPVLSANGHVGQRPAAASAALSTVARDAIALFSDVGGRLRQCAADDCGLFILDTSRPNNRRWCSMDLCGNRNKIRAYRARSSE